MIPVARIGACAVALSLAGCAPRPLYDWSEYEAGLQSLYVTHDRAQATAALEATVVAAQQAGRRPPPGVLAEYGFVLYQAGQPDRAIQLFEREASTYPESKILMDKLTTRVRERAGSAPGPGQTQVPTVRSDPAVAGAAAR